MSSPYEIRSNDNGKSKKQSMAELKLRRLTELNQRLQEDLNRRRIPVSEAALECVFPLLLMLSLLLLASLTVTVMYSSTNSLTYLPASSHSQTRSRKTSWCPADGEQ
jgi:hypothetical protein